MKHFWSIRCLVLLIISILAQGCFDKEFTEDSAESFKIAKEPYDDESYEIAVLKLQEFRTKFPYSLYAVEAELLIANSQFNLENYEESALSYEKFARLHPKHEKTPFALFRVGESYWQLAPEDIDREQEFASQAITEWENLVEKHPDSKEAKEALTFIEKGHRRIAESSDFIGKFYCKQELWAACAYRNLRLARTFKQFKDLRSAALVRAGNGLKMVATTSKEISSEDLEHTELREANIYMRTLSTEQILALSEKVIKESKE